MDKKGNPVKVRARVRFYIEVDAGSSWGDECDCKQIFNQAGRETQNRLDKLVSLANQGVNDQDKYREAGEVARRLFQGIRLLEPVKVITVLVEDKDD